MLDRPPDKRKGRPRFADAADPNHHGKFFSISNVPPHDDLRKPRRADLPKERRTESLIRPRRQRQAQHLHDLGPAPLLHFFDELGAEVGCGLRDHMLMRYGAVDPSFIRARGGDKFSPAVHLIEVPS